MTKASKKSPSQFVFRFLVRDRMDDWHFSMMERVLRPIRSGIQECIDIIEKAGKSGDEEYAQAVADDEVEVIEGLLGAVFVVCQTEIERVTRHVELLHMHASNVQRPKGPVKLTTTGVGKGDVMAFGSPPVGTSTVNEIQALNAVANYFKHRLAWSPDWAKTLAAANPVPPPAPAPKGKTKGKTKSKKPKVNHKDKQTAATIRALQAIGLEQGSTGNLRTAAEALGNAGYTDIDKIVGILRTWEGNVFKAYVSELKAAGVI